MGIFKTLFGSPSKKESKSYIDPNQQGYLRDIYGEGMEGYYKALSRGPFKGSTYAPLTENERMLVDRGVDFATGPGAGIYEGVLEYGDPNLAAGASYGANAADLYGSASNIGADAYAASMSPETQAIIDAALRDSERMLNEKALPGLDRAAAATGNRGSSRTGVMEAVLRRAAAENAADTSARVRREVYNDRFLQGLQQNQAALAANTQIGRAGQYGADAYSRALALAGANQDIGFNAADREQAKEEERKALALSDYERKRLDKLKLAGIYGSIIGPPTVLSESEVTEGSSGLFGQALGFASELKGLGVFGGGG